MIVTDAAVQLHVEADAKTEDLQTRLFQCNLHPRWQKKRLATSHFVSWCETSRAVRFANGQWLIDVVVDAHRRREFHVLGFPFDGHGLPLVSAKTTLR